MTGLLARITMVDFTNPKDVGAIALETEPGTELAATPSELEATAAKAGQMHAGSERYWAMRSHRLRSPYLRSQLVPPTSNNN